MRKLPNQISLAAFRDEFAKQWEVAISNNLNEILEKFPLDTEWTTFMQEHGGFLETLMARLNPKGQFTYKKEDSKIDVMYVGGKGRFGWNDTTYPPALCVMIEHENGPHPEEEMWKLTFWRSPLKVIIFYDWPENERKPGTRKSDWLQEKLVLFKKILGDANQFHSENSSTEYLFLIGAWQEVGKSINWQWASNKTWKAERLIS